MRRRAAAQVFVDDLGTPTLDDGASHHLGRVLRLRHGETVVAGDGRGHWVRCAYQGTRELAVDGEVVTEPMASPLLTVAFVPAKAERPEWVVQKLTEVGVDRIVVLTAVRSVVRWDGARAEAAMTRLRRVVVEAAAQSRRVWLPEVAGVWPLERLADAGLALAEPGGGALGPGVTGIAVGPEGGWAPEELAGAAGRPTVSLGRHVLRAETAAIAAGVLLAAQRAGTVCAGAG